VLGENIREKVPPRSSEAWKTPLFDQYWAIKDQTPGALLFFRLGDFYELFGADAVLAAPALEVQLTSRNKGQKDAVPMCGVPAHAIDSYAEKLLSKGHKVALCEQVSEAGKSKLVEREVVRILTPGLPTDFQRLSSKEPHWFYSLALTTGGIQVVLYDFLAGKIFEGEILRAEELDELLARAKPQEVLASEELLKSKTLRWKVFSEESDFYKMLTPWASRGALENLKDYLQYTQRLTSEELAEFLPDPRSLLEVLPQGRGAYARMPAGVLEQWNVFPELFELFDSCGSAVGSRRLREILSNPLQELDRILSRQKTISAFSDYDDFLSSSRLVYDFERILGRFRVGAAQPIELLRFQSALDHALVACSRASASFWQSFFQTEGLSGLAVSTRSLQELSAMLGAALEIPSEAVRGGELHLLIRTGYDSVFDGLRTINETAAEWLANYENRLREETGISSLKVRYNRVFGYYIEVTKAQMSKVPAGFQRKQTMVSGERYTSDELSQKESEILSAAQKVEARAREILEKLQNEILIRTSELQNFIEHFSWMDALAGIQKSLVRLRIHGPWVTPLISPSESLYLKITEGRHPILSNLDRDFIPNSVELGAGTRQILLLTGPNMAGKSTLMRQVGLGLMLAQCGLPVPASHMEFSPASGFYSRMGASDRILAGESTFMVEMKECAQILRDADARSLILIDEIGRGTSTRDGLAIARAVLRHLHDEIKAPTIFATHYHELSEDVRDLPLAENASMSIQEWKGRLVFLRKLVMEPAESSYGIYVAKLAGLPTSLLKNAQKFFQKEDAARLQAPDPQLGLFSGGAVANAESVAEIDDSERESLREFVAMISASDPMSLSPKDAWARLEEWVNRAREFPS
jgi:DNA mismatch repair protein MutS